jgi:hypothetical protein
MSTNVAEWLRGIGLQQYAAAFAENDIDGDVLPEVTADDLIGLGVASIGHRRRLLAAIAALHGDAPQVAIQTEPATVGIPGGAERRQLTVMFCDLVGSTALSGRLDPEDLREVIGAYHRCVSETVARYAGFVAKYMGDGVLVYFGYPQAHEDDAERSVRAGLAVIDAVGRLATPEPLNVRLGVASGLVVVGDLIGGGRAGTRRRRRDAKPCRPSPSARRTGHARRCPEHEAADRRTIRDGGPRAPTTRRFRRTAARLAYGWRKRGLEPFRGAALGGDAARRAR